MKFEFWIQNLISYSEASMTRFSSGETVGLFMMGVVSSASESVDEP